jgi:hypothetical protein
VRARVVVHADVVEAVSQAGREALANVAVEGPSTASRRGDGGLDVGVGAAVRQDAVAVAGEGRERPVADAGGQPLERVAVGRLRLGAGGVVTPCAVALVVVAAQRRSIPRGLIGRS